MEIDHLYQGEAGLLPLRSPLLLLVVCLGRSQGVVAVPHGKEHGGPPRGIIPQGKGRRISQRSQILRQAAHLTLGQTVSGDVSPLFHQVKVVEQFHFRRLRGVMLNYFTAWIIQQQHHMGQLQRSMPPHRHPGRDALQHGALRGTDQAVRAGAVIISFQIHLPHNAPAQRAAGEAALHIDEAVRQGTEDAPRQIVLHGGVDRRDMGFGMPVLQLLFRQDQPQG